MLPAHRLIHLIINLMKLKRNFILIGMLSGVVIWTGSASSEVSPSPESEKSAGELVDERSKEIADRVGMSSLLEMPESGEDFVREAVEQGIIVEVTLEQVEQALHAAEATPSTEDDIAAMRLAHFGSYRFFMENAPSEGGGPQSDQP